MFLGEGKEGAYYSMGNMDVRLSFLCLLKGYLFSTATCMWASLQAAMFHGEKAQAGQDDGGRGRWISESEARMVYRARSRIVRATQRNPV